MPTFARRRRPVRALALSACAVASLAAALPARADTAPPQFPLRDFFRNPDKGYFRLSEDGRWLGFMQPATGDAGDVKRMNVFVQPLEAGKPVGVARQLTRESARDVAIYRWKGNGTVLYEKDFGGDENVRVVAVDVASGKQTPLTPDGGVKGDIVDELVDDPSHVLVQHNQRNRAAFDVYRVNVRTGASTLVAENPGNIVGWTADHDGRVRLAVASDGVNNTVLHRATEAGPFKPLFSTDFRTQVGPTFFDFDNQRFYALSNRGRDKTALVLIDPAKPEAEQVVYVHPKVDLAAAAYSQKRKVLTQADFQVEKPERHLFDAPMKAIYERLERQLPGQQIILQSASRNEDQFVVAAMSDQTPGARYVYDVASDRLSKLGDINPALPPAQMARMQPISYTARDGLVIPGYLTLPPGKPAKNLACIVNPHGGPWARDGWGFNPEIQFLANRGYCVLQMNFRGSTGYGRQYWEASFGQWGLKMQDDVTDGAKWLIQQGIADPKRIGIYGGSYGGYATLAGVAFTPDLYAAAVDYVGVSNLFTFMKTIPPYWEPMRQQMYAMVGNPDDPKDKERLTATSPALQAHRIKAPLFIAQGAKDPRVNKAESDQVVEALKSRGVSVQYLVKDNEGHGFQNEENRFEFYAAMEAFFAQYLKP
jgi:dipeptidyl aminopeptidase/acylaminoacyl peptidase